MPLAAESHCILKKCWRKNTELFKSRWNQFANNGMVKFAQWFVLLKNKIYSSQFQIIICINEISSDQSIHNQSNCNFKCNRFFVSYVSIFRCDKRRLRLISTYLNKCYQGRTNNRVEIVWIYFKLNSIIGYKKSIYFLLLFFRPSK